MQVLSAFLEALHALAEGLPKAIIEPLAASIAEVAPGDWEALHHEAQQALPSASAREQAASFIKAWHTYAPDVSPQSAALALQVAAHSVERVRRSQTLELVWTGPGSTIPLRRTAQALLQLIDESQHELIIVSFAVYQIPEIAEAMARAASRGVALTLILESATESEGKVAYDTLAAFGAHVTQHARIYRWPLEKRPTDQDGKHGALHAKCAVADSQRLFISSANLTHYALTLNMELGLLIRGGGLPAQVTQHFLGLTRSGDLRRVAR